MNYTIAILHNMARSGGTVIAKCLGCMRDVLMLSEVHPKIRLETFNPYHQAKNWFNLFRRDDLWFFDNTLAFDWLKTIEIIQRRTRQSGKTLLLRDWSHIDFTGVPYVERPSYELSSRKLLGKYYHLRSFCTVRHPIDQWLSLTKLQVVQGKLDLQTFLKGYRAFAETAREIGYIRYEDFTATPVESTTILCDRLGLPFDEDFLTKWFRYSTITGDISASGAGRGTAKEEIVSLPRREVDKQTLRSFTSNADYRAALQLLAYD